MTVQQHIYTVADELRAIATLGTAYGTTPYDLERYRKVLEASARLVAALEGRTPEDVLQDYRGGREPEPLAAGSDLALAEYQGDLGHISPLNGADTLAGAAVRELQEETGLRGRATRYLGHFDSRRVGSRLRFQMVHHAFLIEAEGEPGVSNETLGAAFFAPDELPALHFEHGRMVPRLLARLSSGEASPLFDF